MATEPPLPKLPLRVVVTFAGACALSVANIYYAQPLAGSIASELRLSASLAGLLVTITQLGYGLGLLVLVPLIDVVESRRLILTTLGGLVLALVLIAKSDGTATFLLASGAVGLGAVATQMLVPFATTLVEEKARGRLVGNVMGGLLVGVMLARPVASFLGGHYGWRSVFGLSAVLIALLLPLLRWSLPRRVPEKPLGYVATLRSLSTLFSTTPIVRQRALYQGAMFAAFNLFWTGVPFVLLERFALTQDGVAWFALAGAAGALSAPIAGRLADRGLGHEVTVGAFVTALASFPLGAVAVHTRSLGALVVAALLLDGAVQACQVASQRAIYVEAGEARGRLNALFMTCTFLCGAAGSALSAWLVVNGGFTLLAFVACALLAITLLAVYLHRASRAQLGVTREGRS